jgi:hypothetical protein
MTCFTHCKLTPQWSDQEQADHRLVIAQVLLPTITATARTVILLLATVAAAAGAATAITTVSATSFLLWQFVIIRLLQLILQALL